MIETKDVILFFDKLAPSWDSMEIRFNDVIDTILDNAGVTAGTSILDVACGTGILIPDYLKRGVEKVTAIDISPKMTEIAMNKFGNEDKVEIICGDVQNDDRLETYDRIVVYNAFPHFPDPDRLISNLSQRLTDDGTLTIAHGQSREKIDAHHNGAAKHVSNGLMEVEKLVEIFERYLDVTVSISDEKMYQVVGRKWRYSPEH